MALNHFIFYNKIDARWLVSKYYIFTWALAHLTEIETVLLQLNVISHGSSKVKYYITERLT